LEIALAKLFISHLVSHSVLNFFSIFSSLAKFNSSHSYISLSNSIASSTGFNSTVVVCQSLVTSTVERVSSGLYVVLSLPYISSSCFIISSIDVFILSANSEYVFTHSVSTLDKVLLAFVWSFKFLPLTIFHAVSFTFSGVAFQSITIDFILPLTSFIISIMLALRVFSTSLSKFLIIFLGLKDFSSLSSHFLAFHFAIKYAAVFHTKASNLSWSSSGKFSFRLLNNGSLFIKLHHNSKNSHAIFNNAHQTLVSHTHISKVFIHGAVILNAVSKAHSHIAKLVSALFINLSNNSGCLLTYCISSSFICWSKVMALPYFSYKY
jgi:hypothetical protein